MTPWQASGQAPRLALVLAAWPLLAVSSSATVEPDMIARQPTPTLPLPANTVLDARQVRVTPTMAYVEGYRALGCFEDAGILTATSRFNNGMTPHNCRNWCSVNSAPVFGVKLGYQCLCGSRIEPFAEKADEEECTRACQGASSLLCGAADRMNLYAPTDMDVGTFADSAPVVTGPGGSEGPATAWTTTMTTTTTAAAGSGSGDGEPTTTGTSAPSVSSSSNSAGPGSVGHDGDQDGSPYDGVGLSAGAVAGIAVGSAVLSSAVTAAIMIFLCQRRRLGHTSRPSSHHMGYDNPAPPQLNMSMLNPASPEEHGAYKAPQHGFMTQSQAVSPDTAASQPQYGRHELGAPQGAGSYEMPGHQR